ncbi:hypothetical protein [Streptomyces sp. NPDC046197]|uniref:hypothetical protein n=1 Tax=Streptomyces sp. NPDC046197 TaxID=3154337 RepID=UPI0033CAFD29
MSPDAIAAAVLFGPGAIIGAVCLAGHRAARRHEDAALAACASYRPPEPSPEPPPKGRIKGPAQPGPARLANVIDFPSRRRKQEDAA